MRITADLPGRPVLLDRATPEATVAWLADFMEGVRARVRYAPKANRNIDIVPKGQRLTFLLNGQPSVTLLVTKDRNMHRTPDVYKMLAERLSCVRA